jgi:uncharacterized protein
MPRILMVPGFTGSGPGHWQSLWQRELPDCARVEQRDWDAPEPGEWVAALGAAIAASAGPPLLVGHSLGCVTIALWASRGGRARVAGALMVAPCDVEAPGAVPELARFAPMPRGRLSFPVRVVASEDDPFVTLERAAGFAAAWGGTMALAGRAGHIVTASGHGPWPEGRRVLDAFLAECSAGPPTA